MVGIIFSNDTNTCPFLDKYIKVLNNIGQEYEVILWNREGNNTVYPPNYLVCNVKSDVYVPIRKKIIGFLKFKQFLIKTIKDRDYDKLIFLTTFPAIFCYKLTKKQYKNKYIFDFRDLSYERYGFFRKRVKKIIKNSAFTCLSSPGFAEVLGLDNYVMAHNFRYKDLDQANKCDIGIKKAEGKIKILHIGITRGEEFNKRIADIFGNDERFEVNIVGSGNDTASFVQYIKDIPNVFVKGTYNNEEKAKFIDEADMLLYYYPCDFNCDRALANKYYDCLIYKKPLIGNADTYSGQRLRQKGLGISLKLDCDNFANEVFDFYASIKIDDFKEAINTEIQAVLNDDVKYLKAIEDFLIGKSNL